MAMSNEGGSGDRRSRIDALVVNTNRTADRARLHGVLAIGRVVFNELFDGDSALVTGRGRRFVGYRRFVEHARLSISAKRVWEAVRLCVLHDTLREEARDALSFPQLRALLGAPDPRALAEAAVREG